MVCCSRLVVALLLLVGQPASVWADLIITEKTVLKMGDRNVEGVRSTYIKGARMRIEMVQDGRSAATLYDLPSGAIVEFDTQKRQANVRDLAARTALLQKEYPSERATTTVVATGETKTVAGVSCGESTYAVAVPLTRDGKTILTMNGSVCLAQDAAGADAYQSFAQAAYEQQLVMGYASDNVILLAITRAQTELYRALAGKRGIPLHLDMTIGVEGTGMIASVVRKAAAGTRASTVTRIEDAPLDDGRFAIPSDWKRETK